MKKLVWERVCPAEDGSHIVTWRAKVPGGWLVSAWAQRASEVEGAEAETGIPHGGGGITFLPDHLHTWEIETERPPRRP